VALFAATACGPPEAESAEDFARQLTHGVDFAYIGMGSPEEAIASRDLILRGILVDVFDGPEYKYAPPADDDRYTGIYAVFEVAVDEVLAGDESLIVDGKVYLLVQKANPTRTRDLAAANPQPEMMLFLEDLAGWQPDHVIEVIWPDRMPEGAPLLFANPDGMWLQTPNDRVMVGPFAGADELDPSWGRPRTIDEMAEVIRACQRGDCP
jgi:hypothetical protein